MAYIIYTFSLVQVITSIFLIISYKKNKNNTNNNDYNTIITVNYNKGLSIFFILLPILIFVSAFVSNHSYEGIILSITTAILGNALIYINKSIYILENSISFGLNKLNFDIIDKLEINDNDKLITTINIISNNKKVLLKITNEEKSKVLPILLSKMPNKIIIK